jgi:predicted nucleic acid-binding Zn ribbon protein
MNGNIEHANDIGRIRRTCTSVVRYFSAFSFLFALLICFVSVTLYIRSRFLADVITIVIPGHRCIVLESREGIWGVGCEAPWPGPRLVAWSESKIWTKGISWDEESKLRGPRFIWNELANPPMKRWKDFWFVNSDVELWYNVHIGPTVSEIWRGPRYDDSETETLPVHVSYVAGPAWCLPSASTAFCSLWILTVGIRRHRRHYRSTKGHCIKCGYDLRETSLRCPECGSFVSEDWKKSKEWKIATSGVAVILCVITLLFGWLARQGQ